MKKTKGSDTYEVGFGKPPKSGQFKKGQSGNPQGRPKKRRDIVSTFQDALNKEMTITENGRKIKATVFEIIVKRMVHNAANGDSRAIKELLRWTEQMNEAAVRAMPPPSLYVEFVPSPSQKGEDKEKEKKDPPQED